MDKTSEAICRSSKEAESSTMGTVCMDLPILKQKRECLRAEVKQQPSLQMMGVAVLRPNQSSTPLK